MRVRNVACGRCVVWARVACLETIACKGSRRGPCRSRGGVGVGAACASLAGAAAGVAAPTGASVVHTAPSPPRRLRH